jgi:hypothetical protein
MEDPGWLPEEEREKEGIGDTKSVSRNSVGGGNDKRTNELHLLSQILSFQ